MQYEIKALGIGGILDQAIALFKNHFLLLLGVVSVMYIPFQLFLGFFRLSRAPVIPANATFFEIIEIQQAAGQDLLVAGISLFGAFLVVPLTNAALTYTIAKLYLREPIGVGDAVLHALKIFVPYAATAVLWWLVIVFGFLLLIIPGIIFLFWFGLWSQVVVLERRYLVGALKRSKFLMKGNVDTFFLLGLILFAVSFFVGLGSAFIPQKHVQVIVQALIQGVLVTFASSAIVVFYFSCRCKNENFDLTQLAASVRAEEQPMDI